MKNKSSQKHMNNRKKGSSINKSKEINEKEKPQNSGIANRRMKLEIDRLKAGEWGIIVFFIILIFICIVFLLILMFLNLSNDVNILIATILATQLIFVLFQTINQYYHTKYSRIEFLPRVNLITEPSGIGTILRVVNSGIEAHNVDFVLKIDKKNIKSNLPLFF